MIKSMTGFGSKEAEIEPFGKISVELRSTNHKFLETVFHLPAGLLSLEDRVRKAIEAKIKRGRLTCVINLNTAQSSRAFINKALIRRYIGLLRDIEKEFGLNAKLDMGLLIHLPGVLSLEDNIFPKSNLWAKLKSPVGGALEDLVKTRQKEGAALEGYLKNRADMLQVELKGIKSRFNNAIKEKLSKLATEDERSSFLNNTDITEEIERLAFHIRNFKNKLGKKGPIGKELDFIAQEMQREANTLAAKSFDLIVSAKTVQMKSLIEKIREQVQNVE